MTLSTAQSPSCSEDEELPSVGEAAWIWLKIGCLSFGGPAGQIALMHREIVEARRWIGERRFLHALNFCTLLPGPEAQQLATYLGWLLHGALGGWIAGLAFILPGAAVMMALAALYVSAGEIPWVSALFFGLTCAVIAVVIDALRRIAGRALVGPVAWLSAIGAFLALFVFGVPFPIVVLVAALAGSIWPDRFAHPSHGKAETARPSLLDAALRHNPQRPNQLAAEARRSGLAALGLWLLPVAGLVAVGGFYGDVALFFSKMAVVTFGGAYAVLAYVAQEAVQGYGWLTADQMLTGLGLAETTPGPLILVLQFVGFLAGEGAAGWISAVLAACLTLWVTFLPCFAFVFLGAPFVERLQGLHRVSGALAGITAAVVGVIGNLALWFAIQVWFRETARPDWAPEALLLPVLESWDARALGITLAACLSLLICKWSVFRTLAICGALGILSGSL